MFISIYEKFDNAKNIYQISVATHYIESKIFLIANQSTIYIYIYIYILQYNSFLFLYLNKFILLFNNEVILFWNWKNNRR